MAPQEKVVPPLITQGYKKLPLRVASGLVSGLDKWSLHILKGKEEEQLAI